MINKIYRYFRNITPIVLLYFDMISDCYILASLKNNPGFFVISICFIIIPYIIYWSSKYNLNMFIKNIKNFENSNIIIKKIPILNYIFSIPVLGIILVIISDLLENMFLLYFFTKNINLDEKEIEKKICNKINLDRIYYRTLIEVIYESIPELCLQIYLFYNINTIDLDLSETELIVSIVLAVINLFYNIYDIFKKSKLYGVNFFVYLLFFLNGEQSELIEIGFNLNKKKITKKYEEFNLNKNIKYHIKYTRPKLNYQSLKSIEKYISFKFKYIDMIKANNLNNNVLYEINQDLEIKLPELFSSNVFSSDILTHIMKLRDKRYKYNYNSSKLIEILNNFGLQNEFFYLLTYNTNEYKTLYLKNNEFINLEKYIEYFLTFYYLPNKYKFKLGILKENIENDFNCKNFINIFKKDIINNIVLEEQHNFSSDYDIYFFDNDLDIDERNLNNSLFLLSVVCFHIPLSIFEVFIERLNEKLQAFGIRENNYNINNLMNETNNEYHKKKILEKINSIIISNITRFEKYKFFENQNIINLEGTMKKSILNFYDMTKIGSFELGKFEIKERSNSIITKRFSINENNKYDTYVDVYY